jgi:protocatechuate 3,4-dioxygenase beta subunit
VLGLLLLILAQVPVAGAGAGASISGRVSDTAGQPLARIVVTLYAANHAKQADTLTDPQGRYIFTGLAAGTYAVSANNDEHVATYLRQWFGADGPADLRTPAPAPNIEIGAGEARAHVDIAMMRALAIEGRVLDQLGDPVRGVEVVVTRVDGRAPALSGATNTNDLGAYRVFGLIPGRYRVCTVGNGVGAPPPGDGSAAARACYPDVALTSQDSINIDIPTTSGAAGDPAIRSAPTPDSPDTGTIRGIVVDQASGRPLARAVVRLGFQGTSGPPADLTTSTTVEGVFSFSGLPPGPYTGFVTAAGHVLTTLTDRNRDWHLNVQTGQALQLIAGLPRAYAMTVRVADAADTPVSGVRVSVRTLDGRPVGSPFRFPTDDLGRVRLPELSPGRYIVCAEPDTSSGASDSVSQRKHDQVLRTCYPSAPDEADAQPVTLGNADLEDLEIRVVRGRTLTISGTVVDSAGAPAPRASVQFTKYMPTGMSGSSFRLRGDGTFVIANVQSGAYAIEATTDRETAFVPVRVGDDDLENVVVALRRTTTVAGRVALDDPSASLPVAAGRAPLQITARLDGERLPGSGSSVHATANSDNSFTLTGLFGTRRLDVVNAPDGWFVKAIRYGTADVIDAAVEFRDDATALEVVLSNQGATLGGTVSEVIDKRIPRARVFLFRAPPTKDDSPRLVGTILSASGNYTFGPIRSGDYSVVAVPADTPIPTSAQPDRIASLAALGERVTVTDLDRRTVDLHVVTVR